LSTTGQKIGAKPKFQKAMQHTWTPIDNNGNEISQTGPVTIVFDTMGNDLQVDIRNSRQNSNILNPQPHTTNHNDEHFEINSDSVVSLTDLNVNSKKVKIEVEYVPDEDRYKDILANYKMKNPKSQQNSNILNTIPTQKQHTTNHWHKKNQAESNQKARQNSNILNTILTQKQHVTKYIKNQPEKQT
jgi:hypothetical protein